MKTSKTFGLVAAVWAALACVTTRSVHADPPEGDIWSIRRVAGGDHGTEPLSMADNPVTAGQKVMFKFRMLNHDPASNYLTNGGPASATTWDNRWYWKYRGAGGTNEAAAAWVSNPPKVGVWVSGRYQWADVESLALVQGNWDFSDLVCSYTAQPGDFGILKLAAGTELAPVEATAETYPLLLKNGDYWGIFDKMTSSYACRFWQGVVNQSTVSAYVTFPTDDSPSWVSDVDLSQAGIYIRTIDFDDSSFSDGIWRRIAANGTASYVNNGNTKRPPMLSIPGGVATDHTATLYAWTTDETVAYMKDGVAYEFADGVTRKVAHIPIQPADGEMREIPGGIFACADATNKTTTIFLCATPTNIFLGTTPILITNFVTRTILVGQPEPPSVVVTINDQSDYTAVAGPAGEYDPVVPVTVGFEGIESYTADLEVTVTAEMIGSAADALDFIGLSSLPTGDPSGTSATVTIPAGQQSAFVYAYVKRASDETAASTKGISLKASITDATAQAYFAAGGIRPGTLRVTAAKPVVRWSDETTPPFDNVPAGEDFEMKINVDDAFGELSGSYTLEYTLSGNFTARDTKTIALGTPVGSDNMFTFSLSFNNNVSNALFRVKNQDGYASTNISANITVFNKPHVGARIENHVGEDGNPSTIYNEGDTVELTYTVETDFALEDKGYVFLVPLDEASSNLVKTTAFETGILVFRGKRDTETRRARLTLLDGANPANGGTELRYGFEIWSESDKTKPAARRLDAGTDGYASDELVLTVNNVAARVTGVTMGDDAEPPTMNDGDLYPKKAVKNIPVKFRAESILEPSAIDKTNENFTIRWTFKSPSGYTYTTNVVGNPRAEGNFVEYSFSQEGTNTVSVRVKDKDTADWEDAAPAFTFKVETLSTPAISLRPYRAIGGEFKEDDVGSDRGRIDVRLNLAPATEPVTVKVEIEPFDSGVTASPPVLNTQFITFNPGDDPEAGHYFFIEDMDGAFDKRKAKFRFTASVTNETAAPESGNPPKAWKDYYTPGSLVITVENEVPKFTDAYDAMVTNKAAINVPSDWFEWTIEDVPADMTNDFEVIWTVQEAIVEPAVRYFTNSTDQAYTGRNRITFTKPGETVREAWLQVRDKDKGTTVVRKYFFRIDPQKPLTVIPLGPGQKGATTLGQMYVDRANGLGKGRVWADGSLSKTVNFWQEWNYTPNNTQAKVYGYGYRAGEQDNGYLEPVTADLTTGQNLLALDLAGNQAAAAPWYAADLDYDSFFYCWISSGSDEKDGGNAEGVHLGGIAPARGTNVLANAGGQPVSLAENAGDDEKPVYLNVSVEAIFAKEFNPKDNVGDINADGIPDIFAVSYTWAGGTLFEHHGYSLDGCGDLSKLGTKNEDDVTTAIGQAAGNDKGDFLPSVTSSGSGSLIPSQVNYALYGRAFTARLEIRGFGDGLNFRSERNGEAAYSTGMVQGPHVQGTWIGERDFTPIELAAWSNAWVEAGSPGALEDYDWMPENRTDPTVDDTDGDGLPDGYEYYFWYYAHVGDPATGKRLTGESFNLRDIGKGTPITSKKIAEAFNPNVNDETPINERDTDNDGLTDIEEFALGTNPIHWDTDGDGISDYWEVMRGLDPLKKEVADANPDKDFMARAEIGKDYAVISFTNATGTLMYAIPNNGGALIDANMKVVEGVATNGAFGIPVFRYGGATAPVAPTSRGVWEKSYLIEAVPREVERYNFYEFRCTEKPTQLKLIDWTGVSDFSNVTVQVNQILIVIHDQVRAEFDFDPRTAWNRLGSGAVNARWGLERGEGVATNTVPYTSLDEYLLLKYRYATTFPAGTASEIVAACAKVNPKDANDKTFDVERDLGALQADDETLGDIFLCGTTNPNIPFSITYTEASGTEYADENHGADTSEDGVPDGWTLYVGFNPNAGTDNNAKIYDNTGMGLAAQFAGTDSCAAYSNVTTIAANQPAETTGWINKFWPTDPWNGDTDGDYIRDDIEGGYCAGIYRYGQERSFDYKFTFVYEETPGTKPEVSATTQCVRGGGMNPCTVDTDGDCLPDTWELCFAGLLFEPGGKPYQESKYNPSVIDDLGGHRLELIRRADGLRASDSPTCFYVTGGMDATDPNDTCDWHSDSRVGGSAVRRYDFDQDGLQNFQEYLTQALRHLRWDDAVTPLMGRSTPDGTPAGEKFLGFLQMNYMDGETFRAAMTEAGFTAVREEDYFRTLGYFERPPRSWDPVSVAIFTQERHDSQYDKWGYRIMLPPAALIKSGVYLRAVRYVGTDPRLWDTDGDNMGDYYELFHGLNPLLGSIKVESPGNIPDSDVIAQAYRWTIGGAALSFWNNAWTGWPGALGMPDWTGTAAYTYFDALKYPWMMGTPEADADGDGIRNFEEALVVNMTSPQPTHTDPTPLWITDSTSPNLASYTAQYYKRDDDLNGYWDFSVGRREENDGSDKNFLFAFEENEGYDTDGDWIADSEEQIQTATPRSDPLKFADPDLRQAIWFPGEKSAAVSKTANFHRLNWQSYDTFRQFTVEAWIKPEALDRNQTILERSAAYGASTLSNNVTQVRANFRIGITANGYLCGSFDSSDAVASGTPGKTAIALAGRPLPTEGWTHVALTYDGKALKLYMNGVLVATELTGLLPANGLIDFVEDAWPGMDEFPVVENGYKSVPCAMVMGARALDSAAYEISKDTTWSSFGEFYAGYLDEVRVWDGARTKDDIVADMNKRYSFDDVLAQRKETYTAWADGATRNDNDGKAMLPAELVMHYNFQALPGATDAKYVAFEPSGFSKNVRNLCKVDGYNVPGDIYCGWWYAAKEVRSTVYRNWRLVPWIQNTVGHLPPLDGSTVDSEYWSTWYGGFTPAVELGVSEIVFPNTATPYPYVRYQADRHYHRENLIHKTRLDLISTGVLRKYNFDLRTAVVGTSDLVPLGGAFAKRCADMWDGLGAADAWALTLRDNNVNGIPDWWEIVARRYGAGGGGLEWKSIVTYDGQPMTAREAYLRDLRKGMLPDGVEPTTDTFADRRIADDGIPVWWKDFYGITGGGYDDDDNDGLSNYHEWWLSEGGVAEGFGAENGFPALDPLNPHSLLSEGHVVPDYFLGLPCTGSAWTPGTVSQWAGVYFGFLATDHDFIEDWWEKQHANGYSNASVYDPSNDWDEDGWSNYATARYQMWRNLFMGDLIDGWNLEGNLHVDYFPEPALAVRPTYFGVQDLTSNKPHPQRPTIVTATRMSERTGRIDAKFVAVPTDVDDEAEGNSCSQYLGPYRAGAVMHGFLSPGCVTPTTVFFEMVNLGGDANHIKWILIEKSSRWGENGETLEYATTNHYAGTLEEYTEFRRDYPAAQVESASLDWETLATVVSDAQNRMGSIVHTASRVVIGTIDLHSGEYSLDLKALAAADSTIGPGTLFRVSYASKIGNEWPQTLYYSNTKELELRIPPDQRGVGHVMEGKNTVTAFIDMNKDGEYTAGEPFGVISGVDVGWHKVPEQVVEMRDTSHVVPRFDLMNLADDRTAIKGAAASLVTYTGETLETDAKTVQISISRIAINDEPAPSRVVLSKTYVLPDNGENSHARPFIHEGDVLTDGKYDLDWKWLAKDAAKLGIENLRSVTYQISQNVTLPNGDAESVRLATFVNTFSLVRGLAVAESPRDGGTVFSAAPTFKWTCTDDTLTAFDLQVLDESDNIIYDSGTQLLPGRVDGSYAFTPRLYADAPVTTNGAPVFADGSNYFWRVAMLNAKYNTADSRDASIWSAKRPFKMDLGHKQLMTGYGSANAIVRYYGPCGRKKKLIGNKTGFDWRVGDVQDITAGKGLVIVEAFENADFRGRPMAQIRLSDYTDLYCTTNITKVNATLRGLDPGTLYFRAYIDQNNNGQRDSWESWGYANHVNTDWRNANGIRQDWEEWGNSLHYDGNGKEVSEAIYDPLGVVVTDSTSADIPTFVIYIEDCDVNRNNIPDSIEDIDLADIAGMSDIGDEISGTGGGTSGSGGTSGTGGTSTEESATDVDKDGLSYTEEGVYETNAALWDSDGDGMPDGWEAIFAEIDPMFKDSDYAEPDDVMAYVVTNLTAITVWDGADEGSATNRYVVMDANANVSVGDAASTLANLRLTYDYGGKLGLGRAATTGGYVYKVVKNAEVAIVHAQVYEFFGFSPYTANPAVDEADRVNTKPFTALDKYLLCRYFENAYGLADEVAMNMGRGWASCTLKPGDSDCNKDGIPDGWELYVMFGNGGTPATLAAAKISPFGARADYVRDPANAPDGGNISIIDEFGGGLATTDPWNVDTDGDGFLDDVTHRYGLTGESGNDDADNDGLSNYMEFMIGYKFSDYGYPALDSFNAHTLGDAVPDYFLRKGSTYLGFMFSDHDFMDDWWEDMFENPHMISKMAFDAWEDSDDDGWSNWAEARAGTNPTRSAIGLMDGEQLFENPTPVIHLTVKYPNVKAPALGGSLVVQAYGERETRENGAPNAVWSIMMSGSQASDDAQSSGGTESSTSQRSIRNLGMNSGDVVNLTLGLGSVVPGTVAVEFRDMNPLHHDPEGGNGWMHPSTTEWNLGLVERPLDDGTVALLTRGARGEAAGMVDYQTGEVVLDLSKMQDYLYSGEESYSYSEPNGSNEWTRLDLSRSYVRIGWSAKAITSEDAAHGRIWDVMLAVPNVSGRLHEGKTMFVVFADKDGNGKWTPGEPYGVTGDVDVGWSGTSVAVELTEVSSSMLRMDLETFAEAPDAKSADEATDRGVNRDYAYHPNEAASFVHTNVMDQTLMRVRIVRSWFNGENWDPAVLAKVNGNIFEGAFDLRGHPCVTEADLLSRGLVDLDWGTIQDAWDQGYRNVADIAGMTNVAYRVVLGAGSDSGDYDVLNNLAPIVFYNSFEYGVAQTRAEPVSPKGALDSAQPTFRWTHEARDGDGYKIKDYPAFRLRVWNHATSTDEANLVYDSGVRPAPVRAVVDGAYEWTAPIYPNMVTPKGKVFATPNNYWWSVSMLDAKFTEPNSDEKRQEFRVETSGALGTASEFGAARACVRYYGPASVTATATALANVIHVQAFTSPDFTGMPAGETYVTDVANIASTTDVTTPNALILGLKPGTYYLRAYIDSNGDSAWSRWETWGYANNVGTDAKSLYAPRAVTVTEGAAVPQATIFMEDMDTDRDWLADAKEWNENASLDVRSAPTGNTFFTRVNPDFAASVGPYNLHTMGYGENEAPVTLMSIANGVSVGPIGIGAATVERAMMTLPQPVMEALTDPNAVQVRIDAFSLAGGVSLKVSSDLTPGDYGAIVVDENAMVDLWLVAAKTPDFAEAKEVLVKSIAIKADAETEAAVAADELKAVIDRDGLGDAAFFKVKLVEHQ